ncbi:hypothetical protein GCM10017781_45660 [Deinococcus metalli]|uniref:Uncharacterized protein n=1 Tax=Deinococcus metalli TaxID=1141878 RepID=A0ABQ3JVX5_9DEIO|nr:hypothetical protein GCM10017781_45660 [Deinococcus metalli]
MRVRSRCRGRPFEGRLSRLDAGGERPARVYIRVHVAGASVDLLVPVLQLGSDARGRLYHVGTEA